MKIGVMTSATLDTLGIDKGFEAIKNAGFEVVDFNLDTYFLYQDNGFDEATLQKHRDDDAFKTYMQEVRDAARKYGIGFGQFHAPFPSHHPRKPENTEVMREAIRKSIIACGECGCTHITVHPCCDPSARFPILTKEMEHDENIAFYSSLIPLLKEYHVTCCLENMWCQDWKSKKAYVSSCSNAAEASQYIDELNAIAGEKCFAFCLDIGHLLMLGLDPCKFMEEMGSRIETLHVHDNNGLDDDHTAPYLGVCNWDRFIKGLRSIGYQGKISFETATFNRLFPKELVPDALKLLGATANYFRARVLAE